MTRPRGSRGRQRGRGEAALPTHKHGQQIGQPANPQDSPTSPPAPGSLAHAQESGEFEAFVALASAALTAPPGQRRAAYDRLRQAGDRIRNPRDLAVLPSRQRVDAARRIYPGIANTEAPPT